MIGLRPAGDLAQAAVWGWLAIAMAAPAGRRARALLAVAAASVLALAWLEGGSWPALGLGLAAGAVAQLLLRLGLSRRRQAADPTT